MSQKIIVEGWIDSKPNTVEKTIEPNVDVPEGDHYMEINGIEAITLKPYKGYNFKVKVTIEYEEV